MRCLTLIHARNQNSTNYSKYPLGNPLHSESTNPRAGMNTKHAKKFTATGLGRDRHVWKSAGLVATPTKNMRKPSK